MKSAKVSNQNAALQFDGDVVHLTMTARGGGSVTLQTTKTAYNDLITLVKMIGKLP